MTVCTATCRLCVTFIGQLGLTIIIKKLGRDSIIIFSVAAVVGLSALLMGTHSIMQLVASGSGIDLSIAPLCEKGD